MNASGLVVWVGLVAAAVTSSAAHAVIIRADADGYAPYTDISRQFPGVVLSVEGPQVDVGLVLPHVTSLTYAGDATTGTEVFAYFTPNPANPSDISLSAAWRGDSRRFRANFVQPTNWVSLDFMLADTGFLAIYTTTGHLLATVVTTAAGRDSESLAFSTASPQIGYILAAGQDTTTVLLDNLQFWAPAPAVVPLPAAVWLLGAGFLGYLGLGGLGSSQRRAQSKPRAKHS